ncbi:MAG TPA: amidohydrolase family protein [Vicinamibacteria bacterium]|nr:amidohydrolase family protein [Vicinamibacteria bacterium]
MTTAVSAQDENDSKNDLALVGGTFYVSPTDEPIYDGTVLIQGGKVVEVGRRASVPLPRVTPSLDCSGLVVTAGFWNSHVHLFERKWASAATIPEAELERQLSDTFARYGFTSVFDIGSMWENTRRIRDRIESGEVAGPRIRSTGEALVAPSAIPEERILGILGFMAFPAPEIVDAAQAATAARRLLDEGVDAIKVHLQAPPPPNPPFPESGIEAAVREAHRSGKPVFVHPNTGADVLASVRAGADVIAHTTPRSGPWEEWTLEAMNARQVALTPTLTLWKSAMRHDRISVQEQLVETAIGQLRAWLAKGGTVLFGTDLGAVDYDPVEEYVLMAEAGMSFRQILASLTTTPAERFGAGQTGRIARGQDADLVVLSGDPSDDIRALAAVRYTIRTGKILYRAKE